jgi:hypothetical protein
MPSEQYLQLLDTRSADLHRRGDTPGHPGTVATVWSVSLDRLQATAPAAVQLLELCALLGPDPIPLDLFTGHRDQLPEPLASTAADPLAFNDAAGASRLQYSRPRILVLGSCQPLEKPISRSRQIRRVGARLLEGHSRYWRPGRPVVD